MIGRLYPFVHFSTCTKQNFSQEFPNYIFLVQNQPQQLAETLSQNKGAEILVCYLQFGRLFLKSSKTLFPV